MTLCDVLEGENARRWKSGLVGAPPGLALMGEGRERVCERCPPTLPPPCLLGGEREILQTLAPYPPSPVPPCTNTVLARLSATPKAPSSSPFRNHVATANTYNVSLPPA